MFEYLLLNYAKTDLDEIATQFITWVNTIGYYPEKKTFYQFLVGSKCVLFI